MNTDDIRRAYQAAKELGVDLEGFKSLTSRTEQVRWVLDQIKGLGDGDGESTLLARRMLWGIIIGVATAGALAAGGDPEAELRGALEAIQLMRQQQVKA